MLNVIDLDVMDESPININESFLDFKGLRLNISVSLKSENTKISFSLNVKTSKASYISEYSAGYSGIIS